MPLFNIFSDPKLRARQDQLNAQWISLWAAWQNCDNTPDSAFPEFVSDRNAWNEFYDSGSDWTADSNNATNVWQAKAKEWADKLGSWGCSGNFDVTDVSSPSGIPGVKEPPPDEQSALSKAGDAISKVGGGFLGGLWSSIKTVGWVAVGLVVLVLGLVVYLLTHAKVKTAEGSLG